MILFLSTALAAPWTASTTPSARIAGALASPTLFDDTPWRATVGKVGTIELVPGTPTSPRGEESLFDTVVVSDEGAIVRVAEETGGIRVVVGVRRDDLALRPGDRAPVHARPGVAPTNASLVFAGGTALQLGSAQQGDTKVTWSDDGLSVDAWMPTTSLGPTWQVTKWAMDGRFADLGLVDPAAKVELRDGPNGDLLATLQDDVALLLYAAGTTREGWRRVEVQTRVALAFGWVPASAVREVTPHGVGRGGGSGGPRDSGPMITLTKGTALYAAGASVPFGRALRDVEVRLDRADGNNAKVLAPSAWGSLPAEVRCKRLVRVDGEIPRCEVQ